jgi:tRNA pseudouridine38-40 synthase
MSQRLKLIVAYEGARFAGWQSQAHGNTVQDHLERAFQKVTGAPVRVHGAGRTDSGVHALAQCAHADVANGQLPLSRWIGALNGNLPPQLRVLRCQQATADFHARFSATGKIYRYRIWSGKILPPLEYGRVWHLIAEPDFKVMKSAGAHFSGRHDFSGFSANRGHSIRDPVRTIHSVAVRRRGPSWTLEFDGDGFLYRMVRLMVGAMVNCAVGKLQVSQLIERLEGKRAGGARLAAPAAGLYLVRVRY